MDDGTGPGGPSFARDEADVLMEAVRAAAEPADLATVVRRFTELVLRACDAYRASTFLLDEAGEHLVLVGTSSRDPKEEMWERGLELGSIRLDEVPLGRELLRAGEPVPVPDAAASELVPDEWRDTFDVAALVVVPLLAGGEPLGALVADWQEPRSLADRVIEVVRAVGDSLALAVQNASLSSREAERARALGSLLAATRALTSDARLEEVADRLAGPLVDALGATRLSVCVLERGLRYRTLAAREPLLPATGFVRRALGGFALVVARRWRHDRSAVVLPADEAAAEAFPDARGTVVGLPLVAADATVLGFVVAELREGEPARRVLELAEAVTSHLATVIERARMREDLAMEAESLRGLCTLLGLPDDALGPFTLTLEESVGPALGFRLLRASVTDPDLRDGAPLNEPDDLDEALVDAWRRSGASARHEGDDGGTGADRARPVPGLCDCGPEEVAAPLVVDGAVAGTVRARVREPGLTDREADLLRAVAAALGRALERESERRTSRHREMHLALAEERERVAARLHDGVGRVLYAVSMRAAAMRLTTDDEVVASEAGRLDELARAGLQNLRRTVATLADLRLDDRGVVPALERMVAEFQERHGTAIGLVVGGSARTLPPLAEEALVTVAGEALANVERHARAGAVTVTLDLSEHDAVLRVRDDGLGLAPGDADSGAGLGLGLAGRVVERAGGHLEVADASPGVELTARVPASPRSAARPEGVGASADPGDGARG